MTLAFYLIVAGAVLLAGVYLMLRQRWHSPPPQDHPPVPVNLASSNDAILLASGHGRIVFANEHARQWFGINGGEPDLELMAAQVRPPDTFREMFAAEGRASFQVGPRRVEAISHWLPGRDERRMVVLLRDMATAHAEYGPEAMRSLVALSEISEIVRRDAPLPEMLHAILDSLHQAVAFQAGEIGLWKSESSTLRPLARQGDQEFLRALENVGGVYQEGAGYAGWVARYRQPLLIEDVDARPDMPEPVQANVPFRSYIGVPLFAGDALIGVLQLVDTPRSAFDHEDLALLEAVANQTALAIDRARLNQEKDARSGELAGIQAIARAAAGITERSALFERLTTHIAQSLDVEMCGIWLYDEGSSCLLPQLPFYGIPDSLIAPYRMLLSPGTIARRIWQRDEGWYSNWVRDERLISEIGVQDMLDVLGIRSMALMPMQVGGRRIGMVQINNRRDGEDLGLAEIEPLRTFATQAAIVVESLLLLEEEQRRRQQLEALQDIGQAIARADDFNALYHELSRRVADLFGVEMCGVLRYDAEQKALVGESPFLGVEDALLQYVLIPVSEGSTMARTWQEQDYWLCNDLSSDQLAIEAGLQQLSSWVGIEQFILVPLMVGGQRVGALLVSNRQDRQGFTDEEARLLNIVAAQMSVVLENRRLQAEARARISESQFLRRVSMMTSTPASLDDMIRQVLAETARFFDSAIALVDFLDETGGALRLDPAHVVGAKLDDSIVMDAYSPGFDQSVAFSGRPFLSNDLAHDVSVLPVYREAILRLGAQKAIMAPLLVAGRGAGEIAVINPRQGDFAAHDLDVLGSVARLLGTALERVRLSETTDEQLRARVQELDALERVGNELSLTVELERIMAVIRHEALRVTGAAGCTVLMLSPREEWADLEAPEALLRHGGEDSLLAITPLEKQVIETGKAVSIPDYAGDALEALPPEAHAALAVPIIYADKVVGVIHLYHTAAAAFDEHTTRFVQSLAFKAAVAYGNATRFREQISRNMLLSKRVEQLNQIFELGQLLRETIRLEDILEAAAHAVQMSVGYSVVVINLRDEETGVFRPVAQAGIPLAEFDEMRQRTLSPEVLSALLQDEYRLSQSYFFPAERRSEWGKVLADRPLRYHQEYAQQQAPGIWQPDDALIVPLRDSQGEMLGFFSVDAPMDKRRPVRATVEPLEIFAHQTAIIVENSRLVKTIQREVEAARRERDLLERLYTVSSQIQQAIDIPTRLQIIATAIQDAGWQRVHITLRDEALEPTALIYVGYNDEEADALQSSLLSGEVWQRRLADPEFYDLRVSSAFYLRYNAPWVVKNLRDGIAPEETVPEDVWHPDDRLFLPIYGTDSRLIGLIGMTDPTDGAVPTEAVLRPIELFARQAASTIETMRLYLETSRAAEQESLFNEVLQAVTGTLDVNRIVQSVADGLQRLMPFTRMTVALYDEGSNRFETLHAAFLSASEMAVTPGEPLPVENTAVGQAFREGKGAIYFVGEGEESFIDLAQWQAQERTTMVVPMTVGGNVVGALHLGSELARAFGFNEENLALVERMASLASVAIQNARRYQQTRDLQRFMGAIVESIQQGIVVLDREGRITTFNTFMRQYGWDDAAINQPLLDYRPEYAAVLSADLQHVLASGQPRTRFNVPGQGPGDRPAVQNFYLYPLHEGTDVTGVVLLVEDVTERAMLEANLAERAEQLAALTEISGRLTSTLEPEEVITLVLDQLAAVLPYDGVTLWLRDEDSLRIAAARGYDGNADELVGLEVAIEDSALFRDMAARRQVLNVPDVREDERFPGGEQRPTRSWLGAPLIGKGEIIGLLALDKMEPGYYTANHEQLAMAFANQAAVALENARLFAETRRRTADLLQQTERLSLLNRVSTMLAQSLDIENIFEVALQESARAMGVTAARGVMFNLDQQIGTVIVEVPRGDAPPSALIPLEANPAVDYVRRTLQPLIVEDALNDPLLQPLYNDLLARNVASLVMVPLSVGGEVIGLLILEAMGEVRHFDPEQVEMAQTVASQAAIAVQNANLFEQSVIRTRELETLFEASQATALTLDLNEVIASVAQQMIYALDADSCAVMLWDEVEQSLVVYADLNRAGDPDKQVPVNTAYDLADYPTYLRALRERRIQIMRSDDEDLGPQEQAEMQQFGSAVRMLVPLVVRDQSIGLARIDVYGVFRNPGLSEQRIARTLAGQAAIAIENARLNTETAAQVQEAFIINDLSRAVSAAVSMDELLPIVRRQIPSLTHAEWLYLGIYDAKNEQLNFPVVVHDGEDAGEVPSSTQEDEFSWILRFNRPLLLVGDELAEVRRNLGIETVLPNVRSFLGVPLAVGDETVGVLAVSDERSSRAFDLNDQRVLSTVAGQLAVTVQNARLFEELRQLNQELEERVRERTVALRDERDRLNTLYTIMAEISATLDIDRVLKRALELLAEAVGAEQGVIMLIDHQQDLLYIRAGLGDVLTGFPMETGLRTNEGVAGWVIQHRQSVVIEDAQQDPRWLQLTEAHKVPRATLAVLLETSDDVLGVMLLYSPRPGVFNEDHLRLVTAAANQLSTSINNAELYLFIREQAERLGDMVREQQIEASKSNAILEGVADGVMVTNELGEIILFNSAAERILEISRDEFLGRPISNLSGLYGGGGKRWMRAMEQWMDDPGQLRHGDYLSETLDIGEKIISVSLAPVHMGDQFLGTVSVFRDITRDVEVDRMKTEFISNVSHELRTPMTSIKGYADLLVLGAAGDISDTQRQFLQIIKTNADRLSNLVNDLLNISRIDSGKTTLSFKEVHLDQLLRTALANLHGRIESEAKSITVVDEVADGLPPTYGDPDKLMQIVTNLLDNAFQYTPEGGKITLTLRQEVGDSFLIAVADTGIGIPEKYHDRVFDRFFRNDENPLVIETPGTGLGLAIVKELVHMHGGNIWFESQEGEGTTFYVSLPLYEKPPIPEAAD